ncbi:MAG: class I SAM-dependent methyltransferase [Acidimicrobiia bacterium]
MAEPSFDPSAYKRTTRDQWDASGAGYDAWGETLQSLIRPSAVHMMDAMGLGAGSSVLELACGSGALTLLLAERVGASGHIVATDLSPGMVALAQANAGRAGYEQVEVREMDGEALEIGDQRFDSVVSSLGLMFFPDPGSSLRAQARAASPGGRVGAIVISEPAANPFFSVPAQIISARAGIAPPAPGMPGPFALGAPGRLASLSDATGMSNVTSQTIAATVALDSVEEHLRFLKDAFGALHMLMAGISDNEKSDTWAAVAEALAVYQGPDGFVSPGELVVCTGTVD